MVADAPNRGQRRSPLVVHDHRPRKLLCQWTLDSALNDTESPPPRRRSADRPPAARDFGPIGRPGCAQLKVCGNSKKDARKLLIP